MIITQIGRPVGDFDTKRVQYLKDVKREQNQATKATNTRILR